GVRATGVAPLTGRLLVAGCTLALATGCAARPAPAPPAPPSLPPPVEVMPSAGTPVALVPEAIAERLRQAEAELQAGEVALQNGRVVAARTHFDAAIDILLGMPGGARSDFRIEGAYDALLDRISALDLMMLREGDGSAESPSEPAAIDALLAASTFERPQPLETTEQTVLADLARNAPGMPIPMHPKVLSYVEAFQGDLREFMQGSLDRGQRYLPMIRQVFAEVGVPLELAYLPVVESAFKSNALSRASARGMWQFMLGTAREFGLNQTWFLDERADPEKATRAAAEYLRSLHQVFGDWPLALASYNAGPGRVQRALSRSGSGDFWDLTTSTRFLPRETREYVPMVMAAVIIGRNPDLFGFEVGPAAPLTYETVTVPNALDLRILAEWAGVPVENLRELNPELRRTTTPVGPHPLKVPVGTSAAVETHMATADPSLFVTLDVYTVRRGDTLSTIARRHRVTVADLQSANDLRTTRIHPNQNLMIPGRTAAALPRPAAATRTATAAAAGPVVYRVQRGDTLTRIAQMFGTSVNALKSLNRLSTDRIQIGDRLTIRR
ncbi:MAG TPA: LysM peptidoglycan-binding domain-containing protein, partial [Vicinamibacterales bacterium]|nr:LysM peptidoglycan-binding domain-containing protein [Vicinamibacterales bacterium]